MKVYLVGGAVRDKLLGLPIRERDWVVVGATPQEMLQQGFKQVGRDFPVFLHPKTHEEYALARTERKTGKGYTAFTCYSTPTVTLEEDLKRRDLTINAIAEDEAGQIIDPYHGYKDIKKRVLRHVSVAFIEDPVRILRLARFAARFGNFKVHPQTNKLMQLMVANGEVDALVPERVWQELERALREPYPEKFFLVLKSCQALPKLFPEIGPHLPKITKALKQIVTSSQDSSVRFAALAVNLTHHEIKNFCQKYRTPNTYRELALLGVRLKQELPLVTTDADKLVTLLEHADAYRKPARLTQALLAVGANEAKLRPQASSLLRAYDLTKTIKLTPKTIEQANKTHLKQMLHDKRKTHLVHKLDI